MTEFTPPELPGLGRRILPAEAGVLVDEHTSDWGLAATIVALAARGYL